MPIALFAENVFWALHVVLPSGIGTHKVEVAIIGGLMGLGNPPCVALGLGCLEMVVHSDPHTPSDGRGLNQRRTIGHETRSRLEFMDWVVNVCAKSLVNEMRVCEMKTLCVIMMA
jgi:hypothetical protein